MINSGFNPLVEISKKTGRSMSDLKDAMSKGEISIAMVEDAFKSATSEGGQFAGMLEKQSKTLVGAQSNLEGAIQKLTNSVGEKLEPMLVGAFNSGYDAINNLTETLENTYINFERIGRIIAEVAAVYGTYKAVSFAVLTVEKAKVPVMAMVNVAMRAAAIQGKTLTTQQALLAVATHGATNAFRAFGAALKANWIGLAVTAVVALVAAIYELTQKEQQESKIEKALIKIRTDAAVKAEQEKQKVENLIKVAKDETIAKEKRLKAIKELNKIVPEYNAHLDHETGAYQANAKALDDYLNKLKKKYELEGAREQLEEIGKEKARIAINKDKYKRVAEKTKANVKKYNDMSAAESNIMTAYDYAARAMDNKEWSKKYQKLYEAEVAREKTLDETRKVIEKLYGKGLYDSEEQQPQAPTPQETKTDKNAEKERFARMKAEAAYRELLEKNAEKARRQQVDSEFEAQQAVIDAMQEGTLKKQKQIQLDYEKQKEAICRGAEDLLQAKEAEARDVWERDPANKKAQEQGAMWYTSQARKDFRAQNGFTATEKSMLQMQGIANSNKTKEQMRQIEDEAAESFAEHIAQAMIQDVDWALAFDNLGVVLNDSLKGALKRLDDFVASPNFASLSRDKQQQILQARSDLRAKDNTSNFDWGGVKAAMAEFQRITEQVNGTQRELLSIENDRLILQKQLNRAMQDGNDAEVQRLQLLLNENEANQQRKEKQLTALKGEQVRAEAQANDSLNSFKDSITDVSNVVQGLASGKISSLWNALGENLQSKVINSVSKLFSSKGGEQIMDKAGDAIGKSLETAGASSGNIWGAIISAILSILDVIAEKGLGEVVQALLDSIGKAITSILEDLGSGELIKQIIASVGNLLKDIGNGLLSIATFGLVKGNGKDVQKTTEANTKAIEELTERISEYTDSIKSNKTSIASSIESYEAAKAAQQEKAARAKDTLQAQMSYHGDHHSNAYYANDSQIRTLYAKEVENAVKAGQEMEKSISGLYDVYSMTPEQIAAIKTYMPQLWEYLTTVGKYDKSEYWDAVAEQAGEVDKLTDALNEKLTGLTFDGVRDEFASMLKDLSTTSQDWADSFEDMLKTAVINGLMANEYGTRIDAFYKKLAKSVQDNTLADDASSLKAEWNAIKLAAEQDRNDIYAALGISDTVDQQASQNGIQSITEDTANELIGRITAMQIAVETMRISDENSRATLNLINGNIAAMTTLSTARNTMLSDIRDMHAVTNSYLEDIAKYQKGIFNELDGRIKKLVKQTENL